jgi:hypothetical protein
MISLFCLMTVRSVTLKISLVAFDFSSPGKNFTTIKMILPEYWDKCIMSGGNPSRPWGGSPEVHCVQLPPRQPGTGAALWLHACCMVALYFPFVDALYIS